MAAVNTATDAMHTSARTQVQTLCEK